MLRPRVGVGGSEESQMGGRQALNTQEACSRAITRLCSPPHLAEPREDFLGSKPSNRTLHSSDPWGPNAADLSAVLGGQDG